MKDCVLLLKKHAAQRKYMIDQKKKKVLHAIQNTKSVSKSTTSGTGGQVARSPNKSNDRVARPKPTRGSKEGKGEKKVGGSGKDKDPKKKKKKGHENKEKPAAGGSGKGKKAKSKDSASDKPSGKKNKKK